MSMEKGSFIDGVLPLSLALICVCSNESSGKGFVNCNEEGVPFSIWEAWHGEDFDRPKGFSEPPSTPYGFCVLCAVCGRFYSEKEMELTNQAIVSGQVDATDASFPQLVSAWQKHNAEFFRNNIDVKKTRKAKTSPVSKKHPGNR